MQQPVSKPSAVRHISLKLRLSLMITVLIGLLTIAGGAYIVRRAHNDIRGEVRSATSLSQRYLDAEISIARDFWKAHNGSVPTLQLAGLREVRHIEVSFYDTQGRLLDSNAGGEDREANAPSSFVWLVRASFPALTEYRQPVSFDGVRVGEVVIHPDPSYEIDEIWNVSRGLLGLLLLFFILVNALVWWAVGRALRPLERVRNALNELGSGLLRTRLPAFDLPELASLSGDFNHMAATLEASVAENRQLTQRLIQTQEDERKRIARELHDEIGQCVTAIHADAVAIQHLADGGNARINESASAIVDVTARIKEMLRGMLQRLRPAALESFGIEAALRELMAGFQQRNPDQQCIVQIDPQASLIDGELGSTVYRLAQEALTNVARHAQAQRVTLALQIMLPAQNESREMRSMLRIAIDDNGIGFDPESVVAGFGLLGMRERVRALSGTIEIDSKPGRGTRIAAELPLPPDSGVDQ